MGRALFVGVYNGGFMIVVVAAGVLQMATGGVWCQHRICICLYSPALALGVFSWPPIFGEYNFGFMYVVLDRLFWMVSIVADGWGGWEGGMDSTIF